MKIKTVVLASIVSTLSLNIGCSDGDSSGSGSEGRNIHEACSGTYECRFADPPSQPDVVTLEQRDGECYMGGTQPLPAGGHGPYGGSEFSWGGTTSYWTYDITIEGRTLETICTPVGQEPGTAGDEGMPSNDLLGVCSGSYQCTGSKGSLNIALHKQGSDCYAGKQRLDPSGSTTTSNGTVVGWSGDLTEWTLTTGNGGYTLLWTCRPR